jgi:multidrug efflux pump subunit AcrB
MSILNSGSASTLDIIAGVKARLPRIEAGLPSGLDLHMVGDQSPFIRAAVSGVVREGAIAAALTGLMILLFLGSWRSTIIIMIEIPLAILFSLATLSLLGETINVMTLGGLALAVGILVDDGTVTLENINWHLEQGKSLEPAIMDGARQIVVPAFVTLVCICIVFAPMFQLGGVVGWRKPSFSPSSGPSCCHAPWSRRWRIICCGCRTLPTAPMVPHARPLHREIR